MRLSNGAHAPDVALPDQTGTVRTLAELADGKRVVLFFYPAAMTRGCTKETCHFRDLAKEFEELDAVRVGISMDPVDKQKKFADRNEVDFPLLSDVDGAVAKAFGVKRPFDVLRVRRVSFVLDEDLDVMQVIDAELNTDAHADRALRVLRTVPSRRSGG
jgi:thioredoxin-dependent peroxiredoxin